MPRRSLDVGQGGSVVSMDQSQRKSERSHEENQERAYIAASRRADRSIEARVQSARMASDIHKKRTGKGFRITEEIVMKEEMYEEEDDDYPRSFRILQSNMQTDSPELNSRVEAYLSNRMAMSALLARTNDEWRENEINRLFAQSFPNADQQAQQLSQGMPGPMYNVQPQSPVERPVFQSVSYVPRSRHRSQARSRSVASPTNVTSPVAPTPNSIPATPSMDSAMSPGTPLDFGSSGGSAFTAELPPEAKMLMGGMGMDNAYSQVMYSPEWASPNPYYDFNDMSRPVKTGDAHDGLVPDYFGNEPTPQFKWDPASGGVEESWDTFINDAAWTNE
ncbi:hypothetical protein HRG_003485 [Hirsutella rhossiliensis]|uniref:Uncharacterized protein n=1 Tax=Hirsutella rhossiliensis TaxID=111463 RepID=A0A9P8N253_9HYPO|nr:uncharacterized protein HRG_03485 [Hirsutella rhossiliensis]KAH0965469.1 hypothetical protein HRG_03485 [Hirsutella rhossiliensis]